MSSRLLNTPPKGLVRTSSIEKVKRLNNYICVQQFYILPALIQWLKTSQSTLQSTTDKSIQFVHYSFIKFLIYIMKMSETRLFLIIGVYITTLILSIQIGLILYLLFNVYMPLGLMFLFVAAFYITLVYYRIIIYDLRCPKTTTHNSRKKKK